MADKPSRALVVYGDGYASLVSPSSHAHLHSFAARASCGFLSLRSPPPAGGTLETEDERVVREISQLLDAYNLYMAREGEPVESNTDMELKDSSVQTIPQRFMGLKAAILSNSLAVKSFASKLGLSILDSTELMEQVQPTESPEEFIVSELLKLLGFSEGDVLEKSEYDIVFLHLRPNGKLEDKKEKLVIKTDINWLDKLVCVLMQSAQPGSVIASRLHLSIILGYGSIEASDNSCSLISSSLETNSDLSLLRPRQSYTMKGGKTLNDIRHHHPLLIAQWQDGVTRQDLARMFYFQEFKEQGGNLSILADSFLHEVAFKLWKAPKYGA